MANIKAKDYNKAKYWSKEKREAWQKNNKSTKREVKVKNKRIRRTKEQKVADEVFIWELIKEGLTNIEIHKRLNKKRGYNPPLSITMINKAMRDLRKYHTENMAAELQPYQERKIVTIQILLEIALGEFKKSLNRVDEVITEVYDSTDKLTKKTVTKTKKQSDVQWFKMLKETFKLEQQLLGNLKPGETLNTNIGIVNLDGKAYNLNIAHQDIASLTDDEFGYFIENLNSGSLDVNELIQKIKNNKNKMIIDGEVTNA